MGKLQWIAEEASRNFCYMEIAMGKDVAERISSVIDMSDDGLKSLKNHEVANKVARKLLHIDVENFIYAYENEANMRKIREAILCILKGIIPILLKEEPEVAATIPFNYLIICSTSNARIANAFKDYGIKSLKELESANGFRLRHIDTLGKNSYTELAVALRNVISKECYNKLVSLYK